MGGEKRKTGKNEMKIYFIIPKYCEAQWKLEERKIQQKAV